MVLREQDDQQSKGLKGSFAQRINERFDLVVIIYTTDGNNRQGVAIDNQRIKWKRENKKGR